MTSFMTSFETELVDRPKLAAFGAQVRQKY